MVTDQEWAVVILEPVPAEKFEHHEIVIRVSRLDEGQSEAAVSAFHINSLLGEKRKEAGRVARDYAARLAEALKRTQPQQPLPQVQE